MASIYRRKPGGCYYVTYQIRPGKRRTVKGCKDKVATEALARKLETDAMLRREGVIDTKTDRYAEADRKPLVVRDDEDNIVGGHLAEFYASLLAKGNTAKHTQMTRERAARIIALSNATRISDLAPSGVQAALGSLRDDEGLAPQTCNYYLRAIKQFTRWLWRDGRTGEDALAHLSGFNTQLDRRHDRRALTDDELARLIDAAERGPTILSMTGPERAMLYRLAVGTGFRAGELRSLVPESFDLDADPPTVTVQAAYSKHRRKDTQPIRRDLAAVFRSWLASQKRGKPVFRMPDKPVKLIRADLKTARETWLGEAPLEKVRKECERTSFLKYRDAAGHFADFHALRHTYISRLVASGANIKVAQELARHSTPTLTLGRYAHVQLVDQTRALDALPSIQSSGTAPHPAQVTRTDAGYLPTRTIARTGT